MNLCAWLTMVADPALPPRERNGVFARIHSNVNVWAKPYLFRVAPCRLAEDDVDEAVQHLLTRCALGSSRFKGTSEGEAHSWCMRVLANKSRDLCRSKRRLVTGQLDTSGDDDDERPRVREPSVDPDGTALTIRTIEAVFAAIHAELPRLHRKQDVEGIIRSVTFPGLWLDTKAVQNWETSSFLTTLQLGLASPEHAAFVAKLQAKAKRKKK